MKLTMQLLLHALLSIRITQPVRLKLVRPVQMATIPSSSPQATNGHPNTAHDSAPDQTTQLSPTSTNPMFGRPSLPSPTPQPATLYEPMDWEPSPHTALSNGGYTGRPPRWEPDEDDSPSLHKADWDGFGVGRQRMFPQRHEQEETGLESLLAGWGLGAAAADAGTSSTAPRLQARTRRGLVLDERLLQSVKICLACVRFFGALIAMMTAINRGDPYILNAASVPVLGMELVTSVLDLVMSATDPCHPDHDPSIISFGKFSVFAIRTVALFVDLTATPLHPQFAYVPQRWHLFGAWAGAAAMSAGLLLLSPDDWLKHPLVI
jgi:hypothetical protein